MHRTDKRFYKYKHRTTRQRQADSLILADSLGANIRYIHNTDTFFFRGCTINVLKHKLLSGEIDITQYQYISLIIGTNDLTPKSVWFHYKREIKKGNSGFNLPIHIPTATPVITSAYQCYNQIQSKH